MAIEVKDLVGKRILAKVGATYKMEIGEYRVLEVSSSGNWVKLMNMNGNKFWRSIGEVSFIEELVDLRSGKPEV
jgi:hypothetical protein